MIGPKTWFWGNIKKSGMGQFEYFLMKCRSSLDQTFMHLYLLEPILWVEGMRKNESLRIESRALKIRFWKNEIIKSMFGLNQLLKNRFGLSVFNKNENIWSMFRPNQVLKTQKIHVPTSKAHIIRLFADVK